MILIKEIKSLIILGFLSIALCFWARPVHAGYIPFNANVSGNIGVGTATPQAKFVVVNGNVGIGTWTAVGGNLIVNGGGNVGIGSAWPGQMLDVQGTARMTGLTLTGNGAANGYIMVGNNVGVGTWMPVGTLGAGGTPASPSNSVQYNSSGSFGGSSNFVFDGTNLGIGTSTPQGGLIVTNGNVGIGTWAPATNLAVNGLTLNTDANNTVGSANFLSTLIKNDANTRTFSIVNIKPTINYGASNNNTSLNVLNIDTVNTSTTNITGTNTNLLNISYGGSQLLSVNKNGEVNTTGGYFNNGNDNNIFTYTGSNGTQTQQTSASITAGTLLNLNQSSSAFTGDGLSMTFASGSGSFTGNYLDFQNNGVSKLLVNGNGNVGLGTALPSQTLEIGNQKLDINSNGNIGIGTILPNNSLIVATGNVGIATAFPGQLLDVHGNIRATGEIVNGNVGIGTSALQTAFAVTNGNVGIGTWAPQASLQVVGSYYSTEITDTVSSNAWTTDWSKGNVHYVVLANATNTVTFSNPQGGGRYILILVSGGASSAVTWPSAASSGGVEWANNTAPTLSTSSSNLDVITFVYDSVNSRYYAGSSLTYNY